MIEDLLPIKLPPGIFANGTNYQKSGRWAEGNCIRFHEGTIRPIGGWRERILTGATISGTVQAAVSWLLQDGTPKMVVGTEDGLYSISNGNVVADITPSPLTGGNSAGDFNWQLSVYGPSLFATNSLVGDDDLSVINVFVWSGTGLATAAYTTAQGPRGGFASFVTPERHLTILRGKDQTSRTARGGYDTIYSERRVYFASTETTTAFTSSSTNTGGDFDLQTDGRLMVGTPAKGQSLIWTDVDLWTMNHVGGTFVYGFNKAGDNCGIVSKRAFAQVDKGAYWMGRGKFFVYDGFVRSLPSEVSDAVFGDFDDDAAHKVWCVPNAKYNEITWFYPSLSGTHARCDKFVTFNYEENHWTLGNLTRSAGVPRRHRDNTIQEPVPVWFDSFHFYEHETGNERGSNPFLISGPIEYGNGDRLMRLQGIVPDDLTEGDVSLRLYLGMAPDSAETLVGPYTLTAYTPLRHTARQIRIRLDEVTATDWRVGVIRLAGRPAERRGVAAGVARDLVPYSLEIIPESVTLETSQLYTFDSIVRNAAGEVLDIEPDTWTSDNEDDIPVDDTGTVTVLGAPSVAHIQAFITSPALSSNIATVNVLTGDRVPFTIVIPSTLVMEDNAVVDIEALVYDQFGVQILDAEIDVWSSSTPATATVAGTTLDHADVSGVADGTTNVTASIGDVVSNVCVVTVDTSWTLHTFTGPVTADFNVSSGSGNVEALIVAGGGGGAVGGGGVGSGGGGAGGLIHEVDVYGQPDHFVTVGAHYVLVGSGGTRGDYNPGLLSGHDGFNGGNSEFDGSVAIGGGGGTLGFHPPPQVNRSGYDGGSGGGACAARDDFTHLHGTGGVGVPGQGHDGGGGADSDSTPGGGGGGAGSAASGSSGGTGLSISITGSAVTYAQGGNGGVTSGGGAGADGTDGRGNGGGASSGGAGIPGHGGTGIVLIRYRTSTGIVAVGGVITTL